MSVPLPPEPLSSGPSAPCPNCGLPWPENAPACPNCGFLRPAVWPPTPQGQVAPIPHLPRLVTKSATGDLLLGLGLSLISFFGVGLGVVAMPILYFVLQPRYPAFARGIGFGWLGGMALLLGAFAVCIVSLNRA